MMGVIARATNYVRRLAGGGSKATPPYPAAAGGRRAANWWPGTDGPNALIQGGLDILRQRSRHAVRADPVADAAVDAIVTNVIGTGIVPHPQTPSAELNAQISELWEDWTDEADADGRLDWYGITALAVRELVEAGECLVRFRPRRAEDGMIVPLQLQALEPEHLPVSDLNVSVPSGRFVRNGVEFDAIGRRVAYYLYRRHPGDRAFIGDVDVGVPISVPASEVLHVAQLRRVGQVRGEPWLTRVLVKLRELDQYNDASLVRAKVAAMYAGFVTRASTDDTLDEENQGDGSAILPLEPGLIQALEPGEDVRWSDPPDPGPYDSFVRAQKRDIAAGLGLLYEQLTGDYSTVNDRTWRAAVSEFRRRCAMWQHHIVVYQLCRPVYRRWLLTAIASGALRRPAGMPDRDLLRVHWIPQAWPYINPVQDVNAARTAVRSGFKSRSAVIREQGEDPAVVDRQIADDRARAQELGLVLDSDAGQGGA